MANATISKYMAWVRAAVKDNARLRKDRKAFIETQNELVLEIQTLRAELEAQIARRDAAEAACGRVLAGLRSEGMPTYRVSMETAFKRIEEAVDYWNHDRTTAESAIRVIAAWLTIAKVNPLKNGRNPLESGACENTEVPK